MKLLLGFVMLVLVVFLETSVFAADEDCNFASAYLFALSNPEVRIPKCNALLDKETDNKVKSKILIYRSKLYFKNNDQKRGLADIDEAVRLDPNNADAHSERAIDNKIYKNDFDLALVELTKAIEIDPANYTYLSFRADVYVGMGQLDKAIADMDAALKMTSNYNSYIARGEIWALRGDYDKAIGDYETAIKNGASYPNQLARAHAVLAVGPALAPAGSDPQPVSAKSFTRVSSTKVSTDTIEVWNRDGKLDHCSITSSIGDPASSFGRSANGYVLTIASGKWTLPPQAHYPVRVATAQTEEASTGTAIDAVTIGIPLREAQGFLDAVKKEGYVRPEVRTSSATIAFDGLTYSTIDQLNTCWATASSKGTASNPFGTPAAPASNPFGLPKGSSSQGAGTSHDVARP